MAIDVTTDELITLGTLVRRIEPVNGIRPNISTAWRWATRGIRGHRLETVAVGGRTCTTWPAYLEFAAALVKGPTPSPTPAPRRVRKRVRDAADVLTRAGIRTAPVGV